MTSRLGDTEARKLGDPRVPASPRPRLLAGSPRRTYRAGGFTLVEMIVAAVILVFGVVAAMACIGAATRSTGTAADYTTAALLAQQQLSQVEANPSQLSGGDQQGDFGEDHPGFAWHQTVETTDLSSVEKITLVVTWRSGIIQRSAQFVTYLQIPQTSPSGTGQ